MKKVADDDVVQLLSYIQFFVTPWTATRQASLSFTISWSSFKLVSTESVMPSNHLILCHPFSSCPQPFLASGSFPMCWLFASGGQSIGASALASVLPVHICREGFMWSPLWCPPNTSWNVLVKRIQVLTVFLTA